MTQSVAPSAAVTRLSKSWKQPIRIRNDASTTPRFLKDDERVIFVDYATDSAVVFFFKGDLGLPEQPIGLFPMDAPCSIGLDIGWMGYPAIEPNTLCFFSGSISARQVSSKGYLIDGVAIHGVSGGPVFQCPDPNSILIIGTVSAYHANRATGEALPGLLRAQDVSHFHEVIGMIRGFDEAIVKKREFEASQGAKGQNESTSDEASDAPEQK